jgi:sugar lactone lactonase YvrE
MTATTSVRKFDRNHKVLLTLGNLGQPSDTGCVKPRAYKTVTHPGPPFNSPTGIALDRDKNIYVSDGYGNCVFHKFAPDGSLLKTLGGVGDGPSEFCLPHGVTVLDDTVYVCDRQNHRIQLFDLDGSFKCYWRGFYRPAKIFIRNRILFVCENMRNNLYNGAPNRISICDENGKVVSRIEGIHRYTFGEEPYHTTHGVAVDTQWNLYVCDVGKSPDASVCIHKYRRV